MGGVAGGLRAPLRRRPVRARSALFGGVAARAALIAMDELEALVGKIKKADKDEKDDMYEKAIMGGDDDDEAAAEGGGGGGGGGDGADGGGQYGGQYPEDDDRPVCFDFQKGKCQRGDSCKFAHVEEDPSAERNKIASKTLDLSNQALTAMLTLEPRVTVECIGDDSMEEEDLNKLFQEDFPGARFRMMREVASDEEDEDGGASLESMVRAGPCSPRRHGTRRAEPQQGPFTHRRHR